jgi:5-methylcytosine-specific restriction endonuclease McrA
MGEKAAFMTDFEFIENELIGIGTEYEKYAIGMSEYMKNPHGIDRTIYGCSRRIVWLGKVLDALETIYNEVNPITKRIIQLVYKEGRDFNYVSDLLRITTKRISRQHVLIVEEVMEELGMAVDKTKCKRSERYIPTKIKTEVFERDNGECTLCGSDEKLHYHHITRFSDGGAHTVDNLKLLCVACHAEEHKDERSYHMLVKMAGGVE